MILVLASNNIAMIIDHEKIGKERHLTIAIAYPISRPPVQMSDRIDTPIVSDHWRNTTDTHSEFAVNRPKFINAPGKFQEFFCRLFGEINRATHTATISSAEGKSDEMLAITIVEPTQTEQDSSIVFVAKTTECYAFSHTILSQVIWSPETRILSYEWTNLLILRKMERYSLNLTWLAAFGSFKT